MQENRLPNYFTAQDTRSFAYLEANSLDVICIVCYLFENILKMLTFFYLQSLAL